MRILLAIVLIAAVGWSGYWLIGAAAAERHARSWLEARRAEGWVAEAQSIDTRGFPNRFDTTLEAIELADPETGVAWRAPIFQVLALSYRPRHVIAVWPGEQTVATPNQRITLTSGDMRASARVGDGSELPLLQAVLTVDTLGLASTAGWQAAMADAQVAVRQSPAQSSVYDVDMEANRLTLPGGVVRLLSRSGLAGEVAEGVSLQAQIAFNRPWDRRAVEEQRPQPRRIDLALARAQWGELELRLAGTLAIDVEGTPEGEITVQATNWREILAVAIASGAVSEGVGDLIEGGLGQVAALSGNARTIDVPLRFRGGRVSLAGILPLGPAPRFRLR